MALGHDAVGQLQGAVAAGTLKMSKEAAHELAGHYQWFAEEMEQRQKTAKALVEVGGFGGFTSSQQLQSGFSKKAVQAFEAYRAAEESAYRMQAAILQAAGLIEEVDAANAAAVSAAGKETPHVPA